MITRIIGKTKFIYRSDMSGTVKIVREDRFVEVPRSHLIQLIATWIAEGEEVDKLCSSEILGWALTNTHLLLGVSGVTQEGS